MNVRGSAAALTLLTACAVPLTAATAAHAAPADSPNSLCAPPADTVGPSASGVAFGRSSIDLDSGSRVQSVSVTAQDTSGDGPASGVSHVWIQIDGKGFYARPRLTLSSGSATSGRWTGTFPISKYAHPGTYTINDLTVTDADRNEQDYAGYGTTPEGPDALSLHPADNPTFQVTGTPATRPPRRSAGTLTSFAADRTKVDTTSASRGVRFTARFTGAAPGHVTVELASGKRSKGARSTYLHAALTKHQGKWAGTVRVPRWRGDQRLQATVYASYGSRYRPGNRDYDADKLSHLGFANGVTVISGTDTSVPKLSSVSISPDPIDSTDGTELVTVTAHASDTGSGVRSIDVDSGIRHGANGAAGGAYPYAASGLGFLSSDDFHVRLHKTSHGTFTGTTKVRQCVPSGTYKLSAQLADVAGNERYYSTGQLAKAHITSTVEVTSKHGDVTDPEVFSAATYGADHALFLNFTEGVTRVDTSTLRVFALSPSATRFQAPTSISAIECSNGTDHVDCSGSGSGGLVTSAKLTIPDLSPGKKYDVYANLDQVVPQLTDGNGNPLDWNYAATEVLDS